MGKLLSWLTTDLTDEEKKKFSEAYIDPTTPEVGAFSGPGTTLINSAEAPLMPKYVPRDMNASEGATYVNPMSNGAEAIERFGATAGVSALDVPVKIATGVGRGINWAAEKLLGKDVIDTANGGNQFYDNIDQGWQDLTKAQRDVGSGADETAAFDKKYQQTLDVWNAIPEDKKAAALAENPVLAENLRLYQEEAATKVVRDQVGQIATTAGAIAGTAAATIPIGGAAGMAAAAATPGIIAPAVTGLLANVAADTAAGQAAWRESDVIEKGTKITGNKIVDDLLADMSTRKGTLLADSLLGLFSEGLGSLSKVDDAAKGYVGAIGSINNAKMLAKQATKTDNNMTKAIKVMKNLGYSDEEISTIYNSIEAARPKNAAKGMGAAVENIDQFAKETGQRSDLFNEALGISPDQMSDLGNKALPAPSHATRAAIATDNMKVPEFSNRNLQAPELPQTGNKELLATTIGKSKAKKAEMDAWMWKNGEATSELNGINSKALDITDKASRAKFLNNAYDEVRAKYVDKYVQETSGPAADLSKQTQLKALEAGGVDTTDLDKASNAAVQDVYETQLKTGRLKNVDMTQVQPTAAEVTKAASKQEAAGARQYIDSLFEEEFNSGNITNLDDLASFIGDDTVAKAIKASAELDPDGHDAFLKQLKQNAQGIVKFNNDGAKIALDAWKESPFYTLIKDSRIKKVLKQLDNNESPTIFGRTGNQSAIDEIAQQFSDDYGMGDGSVNDFLQALEDWNASKPIKGATQTQKAAGALVRNTNMMGAVAGVETDENGNLKIDPTKSMLGIVGATAGPKVLGAISDSRITKGVDELIDAAGARTTKTVQELMSVDPRLKAMIGEVKPVAAPKVAKLSKAEEAFDAAATSVNPEKGVSKLGADIAKRFEDFEGDTALYDIKHVTSQEAMTEHFVNTNFEGAVRAMDNLDEIPEGMSETMLYKAIKDKAIELDDGALLNRLANSKLTSQSSKHAQELRFMQEIDPTDPVAALSRVKQYRAKSTSKYLKNVDVTDEEADQVLKLSKVAIENRKVIDTLDPALLDVPLSKIDEATDATLLDYGRAQVAMNDYIKLLQDPTKDMGIIDTAKNTDWMDVAKHPVRTLFDASGISKALNSSMDDSGIFRPGIKMLATNPKEWAKNAGQSFIDIFHEFGDKNAMDELDAWIVSRPKYMDGTYKKAKLAVNVTEEAFPSSLPEKLPSYLGKAFKASEAAFTGLQKRNRIYAFEKWLQLAKDDGVELTEQRMRNIGSLANSLTGRGNLGKAEGIADTLNKTFYSFRNLKGNWDTITAHAFDKGMRVDTKGIESQDMWARKLAAKNLIKTAGTIGGALMVADMIAPDSVEWDPRSSDFGTIKVGNTRFDITGGMKSIVTLVARGMISPDSEGNWGIGRTKSSTTGLVSPLNTGEYGAKTVKDVAVDFFGNKLSPIAGQARDWILTGTDFEGNKPTIANSALSLVTPFPASSAQKTLKDPNAAPFVLTMLADALGIASSTYGGVSDIEPKTVYNLLDKSDKIDTPGDGKTVNDSKTVIQQMKKRGASDEFIRSMLEQYYADTAAKEKAGDASKGQKPNPHYKVDKKAKAERTRMLNELLN